MNELEINTIIKAYNKLPNVDKIKENTITITLVNQGKTVFFDKIWIEREGLDVSNTNFDYEPYRNLIGRDAPCSPMKEGTPKIYEWRFKEIKEL